MSPPFDREGTLRKAEKLLRQGKLDGAIAEYRTVIEAEPTDWNTANTLGDLYYRAKQIDKATAEYYRIADHLAGEGFLPKAVALYKKILKIKPDEERAMWELGQISAKQGLLVDARMQYGAAAKSRKARGDRRGEAEVLVKLGELDGADLPTRLAGARARAELGMGAAAADQLKQIAGDLEEAGKGGEALEVLHEASRLAPEDQELQHSLLNALVNKGDFEAARRLTKSPVELKRIAEELFKQGREQEGIQVLTAVADTDPSDTAVRVQLARAHVAAGDLDAARKLWTTEMAAADPDLAWTMAEMELRSGHIAEGIGEFRHILAANPERRDALVILGCSLGETNPSAGYECLELAAAMAIANDEWGWAAAALNEFSVRVPNHIPTLMRLVEICVDGGLEATMHSAQAQLADAYLEIGSGVEARVIAEDLVAREPWDRANIERFRRALTLLGESDIDAIIADRLSGQSPFLSTDFSWPGDEPKARAPSAPMTAEEPAAEVPVSPPPQPPAPTPSPAPVASSASLGRHAIDLSSIFGDGDVDDRQEQPRAPKAGQHEIDLSDALLNPTQHSMSTAAGSDAVEHVLKGVREDAAKDAASPEVAEKHFTLATSYIEMGMADEAIAALEMASRSLRHRFRAGALLGKLHMNQGDHGRAVEWFERAAEAPAPTPAASHQLLYELASALEAHGESARALAVLLELQSEAGNYRDLAARLEQLMGR